MPRRTVAAFDLKAARKVRGLSQTAVAGILCTTQPSIARWESEGSMPAIYRKAWEQHWRLEDATNTTAGKSARKSKRPTQSSNDAEAAALGSRTDIQGGTCKGADNAAGTG